MTTLNLTEPSQPADAPAPPPRLGPFQVEQWIATGSFARVARAVDRRGGTEVAVKVLKPRWSGSDRLRGQLEREARALAEVYHTSVPAYRGHDIRGAHPYVAMELITGPTLEFALHAGADALAGRTLLGIVRQLFAAVSAIHRCGYVHGDIKPENILLPMHGPLKVVDLGAVRVIGESPEEIICGTPGFMPPEQARGRPCDARSDLFALGRVIETLLISPHADDRSVRHGLRRLAGACTRERRGDRPTPEAFAAALMRLIRAQTSARRAASPSGGPRVVGWVRTLNSSIPPLPRVLPAVG